MKIGLIRKGIILRNTIKNSVTTIIGVLFIAIATDFFLLPNQLSVGGFSGIATIFHYLFNTHVGTMILILNIPLFIISILKFGGKFFLSSIFGTLMLSVFLNFFEKFNSISEDKFLGCIYGGILSGIGTAIVLKANSSTGGTDLLAHIIKEYRPLAKTGTIITIFDTIIVGLNILFFKKIEIGLYSALAIFIMGRIIDIFFEGINFSKMILVISTKSDKISEKINEKVKRGTTGIYGKGMYKKEQKNIIICVVSRNEVGEIRKIIDQTDKNAFVVITNAREVYGKGFKKDIV